MIDTMRTSALVQTWVPVTDARGRTHLEARWIDAPQTHSQTTHAA
jgi:hypothetical protein